MKESIISIARTLFSKNIPFSLYRFPRDGCFRLAIDSEFLPHEKENLFWMIPFSSESAAVEFLLPVVRKEFLNEQFLNKIENLPKRKDINTNLPVETSRKEYLEQINAFLKDIRTGELKKAILSRAFYADRPAGFDPVNCFEELAWEYPGTFAHLTLHPKSGVWMGASPELLLQKRKSEIYTVALAGTQAVNEEKIYHWRKKEIEEHAMVEKHIEEVFKNNGVRLEEKGRTENLKAGYVVHLKTDYIFRDNQGWPIKELVKQLHPTPAVGGLPVYSALRCISTHENYDRRYYCGVIGETDFNKKADLFVNLRCMQIGKEKIAIYVGGGITGASDPEEEWEETIIKGKMMADKIQSSKVSI